MRPWAISGQKGEKGRQWKHGAKDGDQPQQERAGYGPGKQVNGTQDSLTQPMF